MTNYPTNIQTGYLFDTDGKKFDISVILNFPNESDYENDDPSVNLIDFYFGEPNERDTESFVTMFVERQQKLESLLKFLIDLSKLIPNNPEICNHIQLVNSMLVNLH